MAKTEIEISDGDQTEICKHRRARLGSKKIAILPKFVKYGYNRIQRSFKKCPEILAKGTHPPTNRTTAQPTPSNSPGAVQSHDSGTASFSSGWTLASAGTTSPNSNTIGTDLPEANDDSSESDDYVQAPDPGYYYYTPPVEPEQPKLLGVTDLVNGLTASVTRSFNSRTLGKIAEFGDRITGQFFRNVNPGQPEKTSFETLKETLSEYVEKLKAKEAEEIEELKRKVGMHNHSDEEERGSCSCQRDIEDPQALPSERVSADQLGEAVRAPAAPELPEKPKAELNPAMEQSTSGNGPLQPPPSPGVNETVSHATNNEGVDKLTTPLPESQGKPKIAFDAMIKQDQSGSTRNHEQIQPDNKQNSTGTSVVEQQFPAIEAQLPITNQPESPIPPRQTPRGKTLLKNVHEGQMGPSGSFEKSPGLVQEPEAAKCMRTTPLPALQPSQTEALPGKVTELKTSSVSQPNQEGGNTQLNRGEKLILGGAIVGAVVYATEPYWRPRIQEGLDWLARNLAPNRPAPTSDSTPKPVQKRPSLYGVPPTTTHDNVF